MGVSSPAHLAIHPRSPSAPHATAMASDPSAAANLRIVSSQLATAVRHARVTTSTAVAESLGALNGKSVRRRLYDSLKVLAAAGAIARGRRDKSLRWMGTAHLTMLGAARVRVSAKRARRDALAARIALARRNMQSPRGRAVRLPFVIVRASPRARIALTASPDATRLAFRIDSYFEVLNDAALVTRLAVGSVTQTPIDLARRRTCALHSVTDV